MFILRGWINRLTFYEVGFHAFLHNGGKMSDKRFEGLVPPQF